MAELGFSSGSFWLEGPELFPRRIQSFLLYLPFPLVFYFAESTIPWPPFSAVSYIFNIYFLFCHQNPLLSCCVTFLPHSAFCSSDKQIWGELLFDDNCYSARRKKNGFEMLTQACKSFLKPLLAASLFLTQNVLVARSTALNKTDCSLVGKRVIKQLYWVLCRRNVLCKHMRGNCTVEFRNTSLRKWNLCWP